MKAPSKFYAWGQYFGYGYQSFWYKDDYYRARAVRTIRLNYSSI